MTFNNPEYFYWLYGVRIWQTYSGMERRLYEFRGYNLLNSMYAFIPYRSKDTTMMWMSRAGLESGYIKPFMYSLDRLDEFRPITMEKKNICRLKI